MVHRFTFRSAFVVFVVIACIAPMLSSTVAFAQGPTLRNFLEGTWYGYSIGESQPVIKVTFHRNGLMTKKYLGKSTAVFRCRYRQVGTGEIKTACAERGLLINQFDVNTVQFLVTYKKKEPSVSIDMMYAVKYRREIPRTQPN
jgi:hypothetical protein